MNMITNRKKAKSINSKDGPGSVTQSSTVTSSATTSGSNNELSLTGMAILGSRIVFVFTLLSVAISFGYLSFYLLQESEHELTEVQFASIADRAICSAEENLERKLLGTKSLASVISGANPKLEEWPFVRLNNYETIATNLIDTSKGCNMVFAPIVQPNQVEQFEEFAYEYYNEERSWPTAGNTSSFGKGVWSMNMQLDNTDKRYHDVTGETLSYDSPNLILTPMFQHSMGPSKKLMMNLHSSPMLGTVIDNMLQCASKNNHDSIDNCTSITTFKENATSWIQQAESGPGANFISPIHVPSNTYNSTVMTGIVVSQIVWSEIMVNTYATGVNGIDIVLTDNTKNETDETGATLNYYTYHVVHGETKLIGKGDLHNRKFNKFATKHDITPLLGEESSSTLYTMTLYPSQELYDVYTTRNPTIASAGCILIIAFTSLLFLLYDVLVRKEFNTKQELLDAKRKFVRFVSHEVRTPLNSVCMGLTLLRDEISERTSGRNNDNLKNCPTKEWLTLTEEVAANAHSAVDVLNGKFKKSCT